MKNLVICGAGGLAREAYHMLKACTKKDPSLSFQGFLAPENTLASFPNLKELYLGSEDHYRFSENTEVIIAIGEISLREQIFTKLKERNVSFYNLIHPSSTIADSATIGEGNIIGYHCVVFPDTHLGNFNLLNGFNLIHHDSVIGNFNNLYSRVVLTGNTHLGEKNALGTAAVILPGAGLADRCRLGAGAILHKTIESCDQTLIGNPARTR